MRQIHVASKLKAVAVFTFALFGCAESNQQVAGLQADISAMISMIEKDDIRGLIADFDAIHYRTASDAKTVHEEQVQRFRERIAPALLRELKLVQSVAPDALDEMDDGRWVAVYVASITGRDGIKFEKFPSHTQWKFSYSGI